MPRGGAFWPRPILYPIWEFVFKIRFEKTSTSEARIFLERSLDTLYDPPTENDLKHASSRPARPCSCHP